MGQLQEIHSALADLGYRIIAVSPDRPEKLRPIVEKSGHDYLLLSDGTLEVARALGVAFRVDDRTIEQYKGYGIDLEDSSGHDHHLLPVPSVFVLDRKGVIRYQYVNPDHRVRIDPDVLLAQAKAAAR